MMQCLTLTTHIKNNVRGTKNEIIVKVYIETMY